MSKGRRVGSGRFWLVVLAIVVVVAAVVAASIALAQAEGLRGVALVRGGRTAIAAVVGVGAIAQAWRAIRRRAERRRVVRTRR